MQKSLWWEGAQVGSLLKNRLDSHTPNPHPLGKVQIWACAFDGCLLALQRVDCKTLHEIMLLESLLKNGGLKPERSCFTTPLL